MLPPLSLRARLLFAYLVPSLVVLALLVGISYRLARVSLEESLGDRLVSVAQAAAATVSGADAAFLQPGDEEGRTWSRVHKKLVAMRDATGVRRLVLFDRESRVLADSEGEYAIGAGLPDLARDSIEVERAFAGEATASSVLFTGSDGKDYKSGYAPLYHDDEVVAVALVDGSAAFFENLDALGRSLVGLSVLGLFAVAVVSVLFSRTLSNPITQLSEAAGRIGAGDLATPVTVQARPDELGRLARALERMRADLESRERELQMMLGGIAHEVRNPLGGIELFSGLLAEELPSGDERLDYVRRIQKELGHLARLVEEFLDYARERELELSTLELREMLTELVLLCGPDADGRQVKLEVDGDDSAVQADQSLVRRALLNLIRNAIQASPEGGTVRLSCQSTGEGARLLVEDSGPGIPVERRERIFEPFFTTKEKGSGLGLALVGKTAKVHGGRVSVEDSSDGGARMVLWLPDRPPTSG